MRITTHPWTTARPLRPADAWRFVQEWLAVDLVWMPVAAERHADVLAELVDRYRIGIRG